MRLLNYKSASTPTNYRSITGKPVLWLWLSTRKRQNLENTEDWLMIYMKEYESSKSLYSLTKEANKVIMAFQIGAEIQVKHNIPTEAAK